VRIALIQNIGGEIGIDLVIVHQKNRSGLAFRVAHRVIPIEALKAFGELLRKKGPPSDQLSSGLLIPRCRITAHCGSGD
jgi:hypothetical protein